MSRIIVRSETFQTTLVLCQLLAYDWCTDYSTTDIGPIISRVVKLGKPYLGCEPRKTGRCLLGCTPAWCMLPSIFHLSQSHEYYEESKGLSYGAAIAE